MAVLVVERGRLKGTRTPLQAGGAVTLGREGTCDLVVAGDPMISRRHCQVRAAGARVILVDLESRNGTFHNGRRLDAGEAVPLEQEDRVQVGQTVLALAADEVLDNKGELSGREVAGYRIEDRIGRGSLGTVYRAVQLSLDRVVAFKALARELKADPERVRAFQTEARAAGRYTHGNVVAVYDVGAADDVVYYSMEYMEAGSVEDLLRQTDGPLPLPRALAVALDAAKGLAYAERQGLVHGDLRPQNLMVNAEETTKIGDLGLAAARTARGAGVHDGGPDYLAPEVAGGGAPTAKSDLYALGVTLFQLLTGRVPFEGASVDEVLRKHREEEPPALLALAPHTPQQVAELCAWLMEKDPSERPAAAEEVVDILEDLRAQFVHGATGAGASVEGRLGGARLWIAAAVAGVLLLGGAGYLVHRSIETRKQEEAAALAAAEKAEREEAAAEAAAARREQVRRQGEARAALSAADTYLAENNDDLRGAEERYQAVARDYADVEGVPAQARERAATVARSIELVEEQRRKREVREREALAEAEALAQQAAVAEGAGFAKASARIEAALGAATGAAAARLEEAKTDLLGRLDQAVSAVEREAVEAVAGGRFADARALCDRLDAWALPAIAEARGRALRLKVEQAEARANSDRAEAEASRRREELARVAAAEPRELRAALRYDEALAALRALAPDLADSEAKARLQERVAAAEAAEAMLEHLFAHVAASREPRLRFEIMRDLDGEAVRADREGISFAGVQKRGIEVTKTYEALGPEECRRLLERTRPSPEARYGLAHILHDLGGAAEAEAVLEELRDDGDAGAWAARARRALSGALWGP